MSQKLQTSHLRRGLNFILNLYLHPYFVNASSKGSGESVYVLSLFVQNPMCWLVLMAYTTNRVVMGDHRAVISKHINMTRFAVRLVATCKGYR